ncbi:MAG TPA: Ig-like domain-containing protein [Candidatus Saccharimonadales bacterium]|nr:Ig-like domain-containing protein [Candidatus Saccharimonadales bacterium]
MPDAPEKRGPIEKGEKGWPVNPFGVVALLFFALVAILFIVRPLLQRQQTTIVTQESSSSSGGHIITPEAGQIVHGKTLTIEVSVDEGQKAQKVQFWAKTYADGKWQAIGEVNQAPYKLDWQIPSSFQDKAIAITSHIYQKDGNIIKDPGGWKEGIIILSQ